MPLLPAGAIGGTRAAPVSDSTGFSDSTSFAEAFIPRRASGHLFRAGSHINDYSDFYGCNGKFDDSYQVGKKIGEGGFGKVFEATHKVLGISRAVKRINKEESVDLRKSEIAALRALDHPHIVKLMEYYDEDGFFYLVFERCNGPDLLERIQREPLGRLSEYDASVGLRHMLKAVQCCHAHYRGHYDIKPENFMYTTPECTSLMMIDLGLSSGFGLQTISKIKGTAEYMAPECWDGTYGPEGDVWSCGVVLYIMLTGSSFMPNVAPDILKRETRSRKLVKDALQEAARTYSWTLDAQKILDMMLQHDRHARPTVRELLNHDFSYRAYDEEQERPQHEHNEANKVREKLIDTWRRVSQEPFLKRVARKAMVHFIDQAFTELDPIRMAFRQLDEYGYGELSISVMERGLADIYDPIPEDFEQLFELMDTNRDGYISYDTFMSTMLPINLRTSLGLCRMTFSAFDHNKDGTIDAADIAAVFGQQEGDHVRKIVSDVSADGRITWEKFLHLMSGESL